MARGWYNRIMRRAIGGCAGACFPACRPGTPDYQSLDLVEVTLAYLKELPPEQRRLVSLLFIFVEFFSGVLILKPWRFSSLAQPTREQAIRRWRSSNLYLLRVLGDSIRATMTMMYLSAPGVHASLGYYKTQKYKADPYQVPIKPAALKQAAQAHKAGKKTTKKKQAKP